MFDIPKDAEEDVARWFAGHQLFFVQIQVMIRLLHKYQSDPSEDILDNLTALLLGSAVTMEYTADFTGAGYQPVRASMEAHDPNFSGTFSADHAVMIRHFPALKDAVTDYPEAYQRFRVALEQTYQAHAHVCERFSGDGGSLANDKSVAWETIVGKFLPRALRKAGFPLEF
ncbi:MAG: hypothetical protein AAF429_14270 [Pseudomonadota bacterium]